MVSLTNPNHVIGISVYAPTVHQDPYNYFGTLVFLLIHILLEQIDRKFRG